MTSITDGQNQNLGFAAALMKHKALGILPKRSLPEWSQLSEYNCQMVIDQYQNQKGQIAEQCRLQFVHRKNRSTFSINVVDLNYVKNSSYLMQWSKKPEDEDSLTVNEPIGYRMSANCFNYQKTDCSNDFKGQIHNAGLREQNSISKVQDPYKKQEYYSPTGRSQKSKKSSYVKAEPSKNEEQMLQFDAIRRQQEEISDFGSSIQQEVVQPKKKVAVQNPNLKTKMYNDYHRAYQQRNLIDYSQNTKISIRIKLLQFLKNPDNRKKKVLEIRQYFRRNNYNVPQKPLKQLIKELCINSVMDRNKGYILKDNFLTPEQLKKRHEEKQRQLAERAELQKKKRSRKQPKIEAKIQHVGQFTQQKSSYTQGTGNGVNRWASPKKVKKNGDK